MKSIVFLMLLLLLSSFAPEAVEPFKLSLSLVLAFLVGLWELVIRLIPTAGQYGVIGKIIEVLAWLSNFLNRKSK